MDNIWKLHDFCLSLTLDQSLQFISKIWKNLCKISGIIIYISTAFWLETNEKSEIANQEIERLFCTLVNDQPDDWSEKSVITELVTNNNKSASIKLSPIFVIQGFHSRMSFDIADLFIKILRSRFFHKKL